MSIGDDSSASSISRATDLAQRLRDPLHAVAGLAEVIEGAPAEAIPELASALRTETRRMAEVSERLLAELGGVAAAQALRRADVGLCVLLVDDNPVNQMLTASQLERLGHVAVVVSSGPEAIDHLADHDVDLVLMDWQMPGMDGLEAARRIRVQEAASDDGEVPIVALTARAMSGDREQCIAAGMNDFLPKPVSLEDLRGMLARWAGSVDDGDDGAADEADGVVEGDAITRLANELGSEEAVNEVLTEFHRDLDVQAALVQQGVVDGDDALIGRAAHTLTTTSVMLGAPRLAALSAAMERRVLAGESLSSRHINGLLEAIGAASDEVERMLSAR